MRTAVSRLRKSAGLPGLDVMVPVDPRCHRLPSAKMQTMAVWETDSQMGRLTAYLNEGKKHGKKICDEEGTRLPEGSDLYRDTGFHGHEIVGVNIHQPKKKPRGGELSAEEKEENKLISRVRVIVEHVIAGIKRCRIVKDVFRNTKADYDDEVIELACALHNFRSYHRRTAY